MINKVVCFYNDLPDIGETRILDNRSLVYLWKQNWERYGWETKVVSLTEATTHPSYNLIHNSLKSKLYTKSTNGSSFLQLCYARWLAYNSQSPCLWADYDVMNYGVTPQDLHYLIHNRETSLYFALAGCLGYTGPNLNETIKVYEEIVNDTNLGKKYLNKVINDFREVSDMTISISINSHLYLPVDNEYFVIDFGRNDKWKTSKFVHFDHSNAKIPRNEFIKNIRNPL